jgi:hypothetical protein
MATLTPDQAAKLLEDMYALRRIPLLFHRSLSWLMFITDFEN